MHAAFKTIKIKVPLQRKIVDIISNAAEGHFQHRRTGLEILGGSRHELARLAPMAREPLGGPGACSPGKF